jgi:outer membrane protein assembly factor BamD (BamD/ComL family)
VPTALGVASLQQGETSKLNGELAKAIDRHIAVYRQLAAKNPSDSSAFLEPANIATADGNSVAALAIYRQFLKKFPTDPLVPLVNKQIKSLEKSIAQAQTPSGTSGATG